MNAIWGNENPDGPNYDHNPECKCINCEIAISSELSECSYCGEIDLTEHMNLITENGDGMRICCDCADLMEKEIGNKLASKIG